MITFLALAQIDHRAVAAKWANDPEYLIQYVYVEYFVYTIYVILFADRFSRVEKTIYRVADIVSGVIILEIYARWLSPRLRKSIHGNII